MVKLGLSLQKKKESHKLKKKKVVLFFDQDSTFPLLL